MQRHPLANCEECAWSNEKKYSYVPAKHNGNGELLIIGEAPGAMEIQKGEPFVGPTGQLLMMTAKKVGLDISNATLDNAVACHPRFFPGSKPEKPTPAIVAACKPRLMGTIEPQVTTVLLLGKTATQSFTGQVEKITEARKGPPRVLPHPNVPDQTVKVIPSFHPAACLRSADYFPSLVKDLRKVNAEPIIWQEPEVDIYAPPWIVPEDEKLLKTYRKFYDPNIKAGDVYGLDWYAIDSLKTKLKSVVGTGDPFDRPWITVDIETDSDKESSFTHPNAWLSISIAFSPKYAIVIGGEYLDDPEIRDLIRQVLLTNRTTYHNAKFDVQVLMHLGIIDEPVFTHDTMLGNYVLDERPGYHDLKGLSRELLGVGNYSAAIKPYVRGKYGRFGNIPKPLLYLYNAYDSCCTYGIGEIILPKVRSDRTYRRLLEQSKELIVIELDGIAIDHDYIDKIDLEMSAQLKDLEMRLSKWVMNPRSVKQIHRAVDKLKLFMPDTAAKTLERTAALKATSPEAREFLGLLLSHRKLAKLHGTYVLGARKRAIAGRIFPTYLQHGTVFGRLSSRNPNIQNIPRGSTIRRIYVSRPGNALVQCDYSQVELRVIACEAKDKYLQGVFMDPTRDIHGEVSDRLYGPGNWTKEDRVRAKVYVFGSIYGLEPYSIAQAYGIHESQAAREQQEFFTLIPDVMEWREQIVERAQKEQRLTTHFGRVRRFPLVTKHNIRDVGKEGLAFIPQSTANDICLEAMVRVNRYLGGIQGVGIRNIVHDSIMVECPIARMDDIGSTVSRIMVDTATEVYSDFAPFEAKAEFGYSWGQLEEIQYADAV